MSLPSPPSISPHVDHDPVRMSVTAGPSSQISNVTPPESSILSIENDSSISSYPINYEYHGNVIHSQVAPYEQPLLPPLVDDFDSYMFPDNDQSRYSTQSPPSHIQFSNDPTNYGINTSPINSSDINPNSNQHHHHHHQQQQQQQQQHYHQHPPTPRPPLDWREVDNARLFSPDENPIEPDKLYTGYSKWVILVFVPRQAVEHCALVYGKVAHLLLQANAKLMFITPWTPLQARTFLSRFERIAPFPGAIVCDPDASLFTAFGFTRSPLRAFFAGGRVNVPIRHGVRNALSTVTYLAQNRDIAATPVPSKRLKCGTVIVPSLRGYAKRPTITYIREEQPSTGVGCYLDVLSTCGVNGAFVPEFDATRVLARFNTMRAKAIEERQKEEKQEKQLNKIKLAKPPRGSRKSDKRSTYKGS